MSHITLTVGSTPLLVSMTHVGLGIPRSIAEFMTEEALQRKDTDWYVDKLYDFAVGLGAYVIKPEISRYVIDLNRGVDGVNLYPGANSTELCPTTTFKNKAIYLSEYSLSEQEEARRIADYWQPYHNQINKTLERIKAKFGYAILLDAHSIMSEVPRFFEGKLPDFNFGSADGMSCSPLMLSALLKLNYAQYSVVSNQRFKGGYITRQYGDPQNNIHAIQLELSQNTYMNETTYTYNDALANTVKPFLNNIVQTLIDLPPEHLIYKVN